MKTFFFLIIPFERRLKKNMLYKDLKSNNTIQNYKFFNNIKSKFVREIYKQNHLINYQKTLLNKSIRIR